MQMQQQQGVAAAAAAGSDAEWQQDPDQQAAWQQEVQQAFEKHLALFGSSSSLTEEFKADQRQLIESSVLGKRTHVCGRFPVCPYGPRCRLLHTVNRSQLQAAAAAAAAAAAVEQQPCLYGLLDHFGLPDELCEWLEAGLQALAASGADAAAAAAAGQQQQAESRMERFAGDYAYLRMWASKGRAQKAQNAVQRLLGRVLPAPPPPPPAAAATAQPFPGMPAFTAGMRLIDVEPCLYDLLLHFGLPDELCERVPDALEVLGASSANAAAAGQQQQQGETKMGRFAGDYARLRMWAGRGRVQQVQAELQTLLDNVGV
ncbi:hypothetical protein OEZ85_009998 [Tetradesmus obliquus]|uniref:C3H1-type domain-containing protein n=1 Tax=Tetradesmus obliquus TaxID=3088 RepID=A0ABY8UB69_TETOB|nr:hypothetical protein OEZ85_009998 [Tetradesmus obliquus]